MERENTRYEMQRDVPLFIRTLFNVFYIIILVYSGATIIQKAKYEGNAYKQMVNKS